mgnify:CR=1 FL=1
MLGQTKEESEAIRLTSSENAGSDDDMTLMERISDKIYHYEVENV